MNYQRINGLLKIISIIVATACIGQATVITINEQQEYQTIVGFGCHDPGGQCAQLTGTLGCRQIVMK